MIEYLNPSDVEPYFSQLGFHVRDRNALLSALAAPMPVFGEEVYPSLAEKAAILLTAINRSHPLFDGNKRASWLFANAFLHMNGHALVGTEDEFYDFVRSVARAELSFTETVTWIEDQLHTTFEAELLTNPKLVAALDAANASPEIYRAARRRE